MPEQNQPITSLPIKTASGMAATDYLLGIDSAEGYQMLIQDLGDYIIQHATSSLAGQSQTLASVISTLNTDDILPNNRTVIPDNSDVNTYLTPGVYAVASDASAATIANMPRSASGKLIVIVRGNDTAYLQQRYIPTSLTCLEYVRNYNDGTFTTWTMLPTGNNHAISSPNLLDDTIKAGKYYATNATNTPTGASSSNGYFEVDCVNGNESTLRVITFQPYNSTNVYVNMRKAGSTWSGWELQPTRAEVNALNNKTLTYIDVEIGTITVSASGYLNIANYKPTPPEDKNLMFVQVATYGYGTGAISVDTYGNYLSASPGSITGVTLRYFYV